MYMSNARELICVLILQIMLTQKTAVNSARLAMRSRIRLFATTEQVSADQRKFPISHDYCTRYVTFNEIMDETYSLAHRRLMTRLPGESKAFYAEVMQDGYIRTWELLRENPLLFEGKPWNWICSFVANRASNFASKEQRKQRHARTYEELLSPTLCASGVDVLDAEEYLNLYRGNRRPGDPHAGFEHVVDAYIDMAEVDHQVLLHLEEPRNRNHFSLAEAELMLQAMRAGIQPKELQEITGRPWIRFQRAKKAIRKFIQESGILEDWNPGKLEDAIAHNPQPLHQLASEFAEADDLNSLTALYDIITSLQSKHIWRWTSFHNRGYVRHKAQLMTSRYRIYNPAY